MKFIDVIHFAINGLAWYVLPANGIVMPKHVGMKWL